MKLFKSILERLKICWLVLTSHTYYMFFITKPDDDNINGRSKGCYIEKSFKIYNRSNNRIFKGRKRITFII